ncbi:MAG: mannosyltransferase [Actinomycetota bacterium]|nr:mannosyltransferase [Actinomycetota bacterium]
MAEVLAVRAPVAPAQGRRFWRLWASPVAAASVALLAPLPVLARWPLGHTETVSVDVATRSLPAIMHVLRHTDAPLGAYYLMLHFWLQLGHGEAFVRLPSLFFAAAAVAVTVVLGRRIFGARVGVGAGLLLALSPLALGSSVEARPYPLMMLLSAGSTLLFMKAVEAGSKPARAQYALVGIVAIYAHLFAALTIAAHAVALAGHHRRVWRAFVIPFAAMAVGALPIFAFVVTQQSSENAWIPPLSLHGIVDTATRLTGGLALLGVIGVLAAFGATTVVARWRRERTEHAWRQLAVVLCLIVPPLVVTLLSLAKPLLLQRYLSEILPPLAIVTAVGVAALPKRAAQWGAASLVGCLLGGALWRMAHNPFRFDDARAAAAAVVANAQPGDVVTFAPSYKRVQFDYYFDRLPAGQRGMVTDIAFKQDAASAGTLYATEVSTPSLALRLRGRARIWIVGDVPLPPHLASATEPMVAFEQSPAFGAYRLERDSRFGGMHVRLFVLKPAG